MKKVVSTRLIVYKVCYQPQTIVQKKSEPCHEEGCINKVYCLQGLLSTSHNCSEEE